MTWTTIESGPLLRMEILRAALDGAGIPSLIPDAAIKVIDPFITGANSFDCRLQVPQEHAAAARELIVEIREEAAEALEAQTGPEVDESTPEERRERAAIDLGRRVIWASILGFTHPLALYYGYYYLRDTWGGRKPRGFVITVAAISFVLFFWVTVAVLFVQ